LKDGPKEAVVAHFRDVHLFRNAGRVLGAALTADHLTSGQKAIRAIVFATVFVLMAMPLLLDVFH